ncbi:MAG: family 20 glycosylhydrolase, partial [Melioribacteraceae bacterium]
TVQYLFVLVYLSFIIGCGEKMLDVSIIPEPLEVKVNTGNFIINDDTKIIVDSDNPKVKNVANYFVEQFNSASGFSLKIFESENNRDKNSIVFSDKKIATTLGDEGYTLTSNVDEINLAGSPNGLFLGVQTLFQLLPKEIYRVKVIANIDWQIPLVEIKDKPRFKWRGMHLDVGRHLFPISFIKKYIDYIAMHKLNVFHWHLTEDQGWRIEIKKYPKLTEIGAWRKGTQVKKTNKDDGIRYGGFYTQDEIKEIVKYAEERFVTVVPEIELPGHSVAALTSYPELSCTGGPFEVRTLWGVDDDIYCAGNEATFTFLENILSEVLELFPSKYIHIGGDEAPKVRWEKCSKCQTRIKTEGLKDEHELQSYFITRIEKFLNSKGRQLIGWDEILEGGLAPNAAVMSWRGIEGGISAAKLKHNVVMSPTDFCYFDFYAGKPENEPLAIGGFLPLEKVYSYEPIPEELSAEEQKYIMGVQANQWTEYIATPELAEYMTLPRLCALAEVAWSPKEKRNYEDFSERMGIHYERLNVLGINYRRPGLEGFNKNNVFINDAIVKIISKQKNMEIRYTTDGTEPTRKSILYMEEFKVTETTLIKIKEFTIDGQISPTYESNYIKEKPVTPITIRTENEGLSFEYYKLPKQIHSVEEFKNLKSIKKGKVAKFIFPFAEEKLSESFGLSYKGFIKVPEQDVYRFSLLSNDGSRLYIADKLVVDNDGLHGAYEKDGEIALQKGWHKIELSYFQAGGGKALKVSIKSEQIEKIEVLGNMLKH